MMRSAALLARALLAAILALVPAAAQLAAGDIGVVGFGDTSMVVVSGGTTVTTYPISGLGVLTGGGTGGGISWDPTTPNSFIVTGFPFPAVGNLFHWLPGWPGFFPDAPLALPPGSTAPLSGLVWDFLGVALDTTGQIAGATAPRRVAFP